MTKLTARFVQTVSEPGRYGDGNGLYLRVMPSGSRQWVQRLSIHGKRCDMGLGGYPLVSLAEARQAAFENRKLARAGGDPLALRDAGKVPTFAEALEVVIENYRPTWRNAGKSEKQWRASMATYALPKLGRMPVSAANTRHVLGVLLPIWHAKRETAQRVRQRIGAVMKWSIAKGYRFDNPAGTAIGAALPKNGAKVRHQRALHYSKVAGAIAKIRASDASVASKLAFRFLILTATRSGETRLARWDEFDLEARTWAVPGERTKTGRKFVVPLSVAAMDILREAAEIADGGGLVFPSSAGKALSDSTLSKLARENRLGAVPHGFRSSFRNWAAEATDAPREVAEACLAHVVKNRVEAAYLRTDMLDKRAEVMSQWAAFVAR